jgi:D-glycero-D-manno-heptose 1,7-bisphosphate phosphatase
MVKRDRLTHGGRSIAVRAWIDAIFYCPHAPAAACTCRKPAPGLINAAITESGISGEHTLVVGDADGDLDAARSAGAHAALVRTGKGRLHETYEVRLDSWMQ